MSKYKPYRVCPDCGNHLDLGERCDCKERAEQEAAKEAAQLAADLTHIDRREPVLMPGA